MSRITKQYAQIQQENSELREQLVSMVKLNKQQIRNKQYEQKLIDENNKLAE